MFEHALQEDCDVALELLNFALSNDAQMTSNNRGSGGGRGDAEDIGAYCAHVCTLFI